MDDYERTNAREWDLKYKEKHTKSAEQTTTHAQPPKSTLPLRQPPTTRDKPLIDRATPPEHGARRPVKSAWLVAEDVRRREQTRREPPALLTNGDDSNINAAEIAWRDKNRPVASISAPGELVWRDQQPDVIGKKFGTFIFSDGQVGKDGEIRLDIWGEQDAVHATKQAIHDWIQREAPSKHALGTNQFWKQSSLLPRQRIAEEKKWKREVARQRFRQAPPVGYPFGSIGTFHWPVKDYQPHEVLGKSFEAFDAIRMECSCYVVFEPEISAFKVMGEASAVRTALLRIRKACFQIAARQIAPLRRYFLRHGNAEDEIPSHVGLHEYEGIKRIGLADDQPEVSTRFSPHGFAEIDLDILEAQQEHEISKRNATIAGKSIMLVIAKLHYYRGHLKLRIRLGTFLATNYRITEDGTYSIEDFKEMLQQSQFQGLVTPELGNRQSETNALDTLRSADFLLDPRDNMVDTLPDVKPIYTAVFIIADKAGDLCLEISWDEVDDNFALGNSELRERSRIWTRLDRGTSSHSSLVDVNLLTLKNGSAWNFELSASQAVEDNRLSPEHHNMIASIRTNANAAHQQRTDRPFVRWSPYAPVKMLQQRTSYLFALKNSNYTLELTRFQDRYFTPRTHGPGNPECQTYEPRWSLEVYHPTWETMFTGNEHLAVGAKVDWNDGVKTWFPEDDIMEDMGQIKGERGFEQLVAKLGEVEKVVLRSESEMFGGMEVG